MGRAIPARSVRPPPAPTEQAGVKVLNQWIVENQVRHGRARKELDTWTVRTHQAVERALNKCSQTSGLPCWPCMPVSTFD